MKPFTFIFRSHDGNRVVSYNYYDSIEILLEIFFYTFDKNDDINVEFYLNDRIGKLDLGEVPFLSFCYQDCNSCHEVKKRDCFEAVFYNFINEVKLKLEEASKDKIFEEFLAGRVTLRVVS